MDRLHILQCISRIEHVDLSELLQTSEVPISIGVEIQGFHQRSIDHDWDKQVVLFQEKLAQFNGTVAFHGASFDLNPGSVDQKVVELTRYRYLQSIQLARLLHSSYVIFHSQLNPFLKIERLREEAIRNQLAFWDELVKTIRDEDITLLIENVFEDDYTDLLSLIQQINSPKVQICLDIGHVLAYSTKPLAEWVEALKPYIKYVHLHWNDRTNDSHLPPDENFLHELFQLFVAHDLKPIISLEYRTEDIQHEVQRVSQAFYLTTRKD